MRKDMELSDKIGELFQLKEDQFDPNVHLANAEQIVKEFGRKGHWFQLTDALSYTTESEKMEAEQDKVGYYIINHHSRLLGSALSGFYPKLDITHWHDNIFGNGHHKFENLNISYEGSEVKVITKRIIVPYTISIPLGRRNLKLSFMEPEIVWRYKA